ncbi:DUF805 domain-containing protein [Qipengyuania sp. 1XM1-15A]|uniref:DUF805 domain-containing protein n=1 Tax=Qipengyuania xiamenensis TaxID=2867237 RepID=UPI001C87A73D|nr:DUF805 domain-containing protein [Qipengyuania xiamenensis]
MKNLLDRVIGYRINRPTYWANLLGIIALLAALIYFDIIGESNGSGAIVVVFAILAGTRLHDIGISAKYALAGAVVHSILGVFLIVAKGLEQALVPLGLLNLAFLVLLVWLGLVPGEKDANEWGPRPPDGINWKRPEQERAGE